MDIVLSVFDNFNVGFNVVPEAEYVPPEYNRITETTIF